MPHFDYHTATAAAEERRLQMLATLNGYHIDLTLSALDRIARDPNDIRAEVAQSVLLWLYEPAAPIVGLQTIPPRERMVFINAIVAAPIDRELLKLSAREIEEWHNEWLRQES